MKNGLIGFVLLMTVGVTNPAELRADKLSELRVSENHRFLVRAEGSTFFPIADTAWYIPWKLNRSEVEIYLQRRKDQKFNTIALTAFPEYAEVGANQYGDSAFNVHNGRHNPLQPITTPGNNPENPTEYDYWDHLEYIIDTSASKGMYIVLLPSWGGCVSGAYGSGRVTPELIFNATNAYQYGQWLGQRFKSKTNIIWMLGGDRSAVYGKRDYRAVFRIMAEGIADGVNGINQPDGKADYTTTLMSYHPQKWAPNSSKWFHNDAWLDFNSVQDQPEDQIVATALDYGLDPIKPTWLFEGGYEKRGKDYKAWQIRFQSYQTVFAGGFGVTYGNMDIYHFSDKDSHLNESVATKKVAKWPSSLDDPGALDMQHLLYLMESLTREQFLDRIPDQSLINGDQGHMEGREGFRSKRIQATRSRKGDYAMVYTANGRNITLNMDRLAAPRMNAFWFNPRNGKWQVKDDEFTDRKPFAENIPSGPTTPTRKFNPPGNPTDGSDWVLILKTIQ